MVGVEASKRYALQNSASSKRLQEGFDGATSKKDGIFAFIRVYSRLFSELDICMDRKETDTTLGRAPQSPLALNTIENTEESPVTLPSSTVPVVTPSTAYPHPVYKSPVADPNPALSPLEAQAALAADAHALAPFASAGSLFAPPGSVFAPTTQTAEMMQAETVNAAIWQKLAHLVHTPSRFAGLWPFLTFVASIGIFASLISTNGWMLITCSLLLAAFRKAGHVHTVKAHARDALNMAPFDLRWVAPLTRAINSPHTRVQGVSAQILACLLPRLRSEDAPLLNAEHRAILNQKLAANRRRDSPSEPFYSGGVGQCGRSGSGSHCGSSGA